MKKILFLVLFLSFFVSTNVLAKEWENYTYFDTESIEFSNIYAKHILLINLDDQKVVYQKSEEEKIQMASLTKIMTALVAIEKIQNLDEKVTIPSSAFSNLNGYALAGFKAGDIVSYRDLLYGTLLPSGAEAAQALAILVSGSLQNFVLEMNESANRIGLVNTHYSNPVGRDDLENYSTLSDLAKLLLYALDNEEFYKIYTSRSYETTNGIKLLSTLVLPSSKYALDVSSIQGSKSGFTNQAGLCLSSIAEYNGISYLLILTDSLYANGFPNHIVDSLNLYQYFSTHYGYQNVLTEGQELYSIPIIDGYLDEYTIYSTINFPMFLPKDSQVFLHYSGLEQLDFKVKQNEQIGIIEVTYNDQVLYTYPVYLTEKIKYKYSNLKICFVCIFSICIFLLFLFKRRKKRGKLCRSI